MAIFANKLALALTHFAWLYPFEYWFPNSNCLVFQSSFSKSELVDRLSLIFLSLLKLSMDGNILDYCALFGAYSCF